MLKSFEGEFSFGKSAVEIVVDDAIVKIGVVHPLHVQFMDGVGSDVEYLSDFPQRYLRSFVVRVPLKGVVFIKFPSQQLESPFADNFLPFLHSLGFQPSGFNLKQFLHLLLFLLHPLNIQFLLPFDFPLDKVNVELGTALRPISFSLFEDGGLIVINIDDSTAIAGEAAFEMREKSGFLILQLKILVVVDLLGRFI